MIALLQGLPLRVRVIVALAAAVVPFATVLVFANLWVYQPMQDDVQLLSDEIQGRFEEVASLQLLLVRSAMPPNDYLVHGREDERIRFEILAGRVETTLKSLQRAGDDRHPRERARLADMAERWGAVRSIGDTLLHWPSGRPLAEAADAMEDFDRRIEALAEDAESLLAHVRLELEEARTRAIRRRHDLNRFVALSTVVAGILTVLLVAYLGRVLMNPLGPRPPITRRETAASNGRRESADAPGVPEEVSPSDPAPAIDAVTRMWSRPSLHHQLAIETERAMVLETPSSLMLLSIDQFSEISAHADPQAVDRVLMFVAERIRHVIRQTDFPARSGEAEFAVLMPATELARAAEIAARICAHIAERPVTVGGISSAVTVSVGVAGDVSARAGHAGASTLLGRADQALHRAHRLGGNRVELSGAMRT